MTKAKQKQIAEEKAEAIAQLKEWLQPGDTVYTILRHVSKTGMSRVVDVYTTVDGQLQWLTPWVEKATAFVESGYCFPRSRKYEGLTVSGCGMDVGFEVVYNLGRCMWPEGFATERGRNGDTSGWDSDGGYALKQQWL